MDTKSRSARHALCMSALVGVLATTLTAAAQEGSPPASGPESLTIFDFEEGPQDWAIPEWALTSPDYVGKTFHASTAVASHGHGSVELTAEFPGGGRWTGAYAEIEMHVTDWTQFGAIVLDVYVPPEAPKGLQARLILTVGEQWTWTEMNRALPLVPGQWTTLTANLKPGSMDWKFFPEDSFRRDIRKVGVRVESDKAPAYTGSVFFDNVRLLKSPPHSMGES